MMNSNNNEGDCSERLFDYLRDVIYTPDKAVLDRSTLPDSQQKLADGLEQLGKFTSEYYEAANALASGKVSAEIKERTGNPLTAPLKTIQANIAHLAYMSKLALRDDAEQHVEYLGSLADSFNEVFSELKEQRDRLLRGAYTDALTGAGNRLRFDIKIEELWSKELSAVMAIVDVNDVAYCNEHAGHLEGDIYIMQVCNCLQADCREDEWVYRVGEDEFAIISLHATKEALKLRLEDLQESFSGKYAVAKSYPCGFTSRCVELVPAQVNSYQELLQKAEQEILAYRLRQQKKQQVEMCSVPAEGNSILDRNKGLFGEHYGLDSLIFDALSRTSQKSYVFICNMHNNVSRWSLNAIRDFGMPGEYMMDAGFIWLEHIHPDDRAAYLDELNAVFKGGKEHSQIQYRARNAKGVYVVCNVDAYVIRGMDGVPDFYAGTIVKSGVISNVDRLTNLYNVYEFMSVLRRRRTRRGGCNILTFEICEFSSINSFYGFNTGNQVLVTFAKEMQKLLKDTRSLLFRIAGTKFTIISEGCGKEEIKALWDKISMLGRKGVRVRGKQIGFYLNGFVLGLQYADIDVSVILTQIENYLGQARQCGKDELFFIDNMENERLYCKARKLSTIRKAVLDNCQGFYMLYQPQVGVSGKVMGAEALLRWRNDEWGIVPPNEFIPALEKDICFYELGMWILRTAMREAKHLTERNPEFELSVNVSYSQLANACFHDDVLNAVEETGFPKKNLVLEFTEHADNVNSKVLCKHVEFFHEHGIRIASDDFCTGYNALLLLKEVPFDEIKIDRAFIKDIAVDRNDQIIVSTLIDCMCQLGVRVCIEGIETQEVMDIIHPYGASMFQGYLFSKPTELENVSALMA